MRPRKCLAACSFWAFFVVDSVQFIFLLWACCFAFFSRSHNTDGTKCATEPHRSPTYLCPTGHPTGQRSTPLSYHSSLFSHTNKSRPQLYSNHAAFHSPHSLHVYNSTFFFPPALSSFCYFFFSDFFQSNNKGCRKHLHLGRSSFPRTGIDKKRPAPRRGCVGRDRPQGKE